MKIFSAENIPGLGKLWRLWHPDDLNGATPLDEDAWFNMYQPLLLQVANSPQGRDLLHIPNSLPRIEKITPSAIHWCTGTENQWQGEFRTGPKYGNLIRYQWPAFKRIAKGFYERQVYGRTILEPVLNVGGQLVAAHATDTFYPSPAYSAPVDGRVGRTQPLDATYTSYASWSYIRNVTPGNYINSENAQDDICKYQADGTYYNYLIRGMTLFNTASIADTASISAATYSLYVTFKDTIANQNYTYLLRCNPSSSSILQNSDYNAGTTRWPGEGSPMCDDTTLIGSYSTSSYRNFTFNAQGISDIDVTGYTKVGVRLSRDVLNSSPSVSSGSEGYTIYFAEQTGTANDPKLVVTYTVSTFVPRAVVVM